MSYAVTVAPERVAIEERMPDRADARVAGDTAAWVQAFSPNGDRDALEITGDRQFAELLLAALAARSPKLARATAAA